MRTKEEILDAFTPVKTLTNTQSARLMHLENAFKEVALVMEDMVPESANRTAALRKVLEAKFTCVQEVTHSKELRSHEKTSQIVEAERAAEFKEKEQEKAKFDLEKAKQAQRELEAKQQIGTKKSEREKHV